MARELNVLNLATALRSQSLVLAKSSGSYEVSIAVLDHSVPLYCKLSMYLWMLSLLTVSQLR